MINPGYYNLSHLSFSSFMFNENIKISVTTKMETICRIFKREMGVLNETNGNSEFRRSLS